MKISSLSNSENSQAPTFNWANSKWLSCILSCLKNICLPFILTLKQCIFFQRKCPPQLPCTSCLYSMDESLHAEPKWYKIKGQASLLSTKIVLQKLTLSILNTQNRYDCQKCIAKFWKVNRCESHLSACLRSAMEWKSAMMCEPQTSYSQPTWASYIGSANLLSS